MNKLFYIEPIRKDSDFEKGAKIVRVQPSIDHNRSFIGEQLILIGIANGRIYLKRLDETQIAIFKSDELDRPSIQTR